MKPTEIYIKLQKAAQTAAGKLPAGKLLQAYWLEEQPENIYIPYASSLAVLPLKGLTILL